MTLSRGLKKPSKQPSIAACNTSHHHCKHWLLGLGFTVWHSCLLHYQQSLVEKVIETPANPVNISLLCSSFHFEVFLSHHSVLLCPPPPPPPHLGGWRFCGFIVSALYLGWIGVVPKPQLDHCIVGLGKMPYFHSTSLSPLSRSGRGYERTDKIRGVMVIVESGGVYHLGINI